MRLSLALALMLAQTASGFTVAPLVATGASASARQKSTTLLLEKDVIDRRGGRVGRRGRGRPLGPNGHDYNVSKAAGPSLSVLPEPEIHRLIAERLQCKMTRDFPRVDSILKELHSAGVRLDDYRKEWRADGQGFVKSEAPSVSVVSEPEMHRLDPETLQGRISRDLLRARSIREELLSPGARLDRYRTESRADLPNGHDYNLSEKAGPSVSVLPESEIHRLIAERLQCKMTRDYPRVDSILEELHSAGVRLDEYRKEWRADGQGFEKADSNRPYEMSPEAGPSVSVLSEHEMHRLFAERLQCKMNRDFPRAESIRAELFSAGVRIHDGNREWRADGQGYGKVDPNLPYEMSPDAGPSVSVLAEPEIHRLISETLQCMLTHDFIRVNSIRAELFSAGVRLDDYRRLWRADGQGFVRANRPYEMSPGAGPSVSVLPDPEIYRLIAERLQCRLSRDFQRADSILAELTSAGVRLDDGRREWRADGQGIRKADPNRPGGRIANADRYTSYRMAPEAGPNLSVLPEPEIHRLVAERLQCRLIRDFVMADSIRAELFSAGVTLDDGRRQWRADASGSNRHEYKISQDAGPSVAVLPEPEIHRLIAARWQCKISRDFPGANSIQEELYSAGVMLDDYRKEWRADGQGFGNADPNLA